MKLSQAQPMLKADTDSFKYYVQDLLTFLQYLRIWPFEQGFSRYKILPVTTVDIILILGTLSLVVAEFMAAIMNFTIEQFANSIATSGLHATGFLKWVFCIRKSKEITILMGELEKCHSICIDDNDEEGNRKYKSRIERARSSSNLFVYVWSCFCVYGVLHWALTPVFLMFTVTEENSPVLNYTSLTPYVLPFVGWYPWDTDHFSGYLYTYSLQIVGALGSGLGTVSYDVLYVTILIAVCAQLQYLNVSLDESVYIDARTQQTRSILERKLKNYVDHHKAVMKVLDDLQVLVSPIMFAQCIETLIVICLLSVQGASIEIKMDLECLMTVWMKLEYFLAAATQLYIFCFYATQIKSLSLNVADSVYCSGWEHAVAVGNKNSRAGGILIIPDVKYYIGMIMVRAQKPIILTGGPFYELSLQTFKTIIGMAISNSMILRQVSEA